jgi:DNA-binding Xre family transcriptional regulator
MAIVYKHYTLDTKKLFYIGIGLNEKRAYSKRSRNQLWKNIVLKHNYYVEIFKNNISYNDAKKLEIELISKYGRLNLKTGILCNMTDGGDGCFNLSNESKLSISNNLKGKKQSEETKLKRKISLKKAWENNELRELKRQQTLKLHQNGFYSNVDYKRKEKLPFQGCKIKLSNSLKKYYENNKPHNFINLSEQKLLEIKEDCLKGIKLNTLAKKHNYSRNLMLRIISENKLELKKSIKISYNDLFDLYINKNLSQLELSKELKCSLSNIERLLRVNKLRKCDHQKIV